MGRKILPLQRPFRPHGKSSYDLGAVVEGFGCGFGEFW